MLTRKQLIAEIKNKLKNYAQQGLLDEISINNWIKETLKQFGGNLMYEYQTAIIVEKGRAKLPDNFWALKGAVKCEQEGYVEEKVEKHIQQRISYLEWTDINDYYNYIEGRPCLEDEDSKYITETLYFEIPKKSYKFYYRQPKLLNLKPHVYKVRCTEDALNLTNDSEFNISIDENHNYISTNFNDGFIWLWYKGMPIDEKGDLVIPSTSRDTLQNYIIYFVVCKVLEDLWLSEDDVNIQNKLQYFSQIRDGYFADCKSDTISKGMVGWSTRLLNNNRRNTNKFENMYRNL
ncbi:MAG: hypothetical protein ACJAVA_000161 [Flavobacteriaceae bacterium]|jgi:hypothetical protein